MNKLTAFFAVVAVCVTLAEAVTRDEAFQLARQTCNRVRALQGIALQRAIRESFAKATTPQQKSCIGSLISPANAELNAAINQAWEKLSAEYGTMSPDQLATYDTETVTGELNQRFLATVSPLNSVNQIRQCV